MRIISYNVNRLITPNLTGIAGGAGGFLPCVNNKGWRIDYISVTEPLKDGVKDAEICPDVMHSDHCAVYVEISDQ